MGGPLPPVSFLEEWTSPPGDPPCPQWVVRPRVDWWAGCGPFWPPPPLFNYDLQLLVPLLPPTATATIATGAPGTCGMGDK